MHAIEKIMARASGLKSVSTGEVIEAQVDVAMINERQGPRVAQNFRDFGFKRVLIPEKVFIGFDHQVSPTRPEAAERQKYFREFLDEHSISYGYSVGEGVMHQIVMDHGWALPGELLVGNDSHSVTPGACGCAAAGIGQTEMVAVLVTGRLWMRVPEVIKVEVHGNLGPGVFGKDLALTVIHRIGTRGALYRGIEFGGPAMASLNQDVRATLSNASIEMGAKFGFIDPDEITLAYLQGRAKREFWIPRTDPGYRYVETFKFDLGEIGPVISKPHNVNNLAPIGEVLGLAVDQGVIGTCAGGRLDDLHQAAGVLKGRKIHRRVRLIVTPASKEIYLKALADGTIAAIVEAGGSVNPPRCGPCASSMDGILAPGERAIINTTRNFKGRMGAGAELYMGSAATVAASAIEGAIADPRGYLSHESGERQAGLRN